MCSSRRKNEQEEQACERVEWARLAKRDREERSRVEREEERARGIRHKIEGGKESTVYVNTRAIDRKLLPIKLVVNSRDSILRVKSMIESVVGLTTHEMIISNACDEEMSDEKSLAMCKVALGSFVFVKRRQVGTTKDFFEVVLA
jgi:phosphotransacetylase